MKKIQRILRNIHIEKIGHGGVGIGHTEDGKAILVSGGVLPGAIVDVHITKSKKAFCEGRAFFVHTRSPHEDIPALCPHFYAPTNPASEMPAYQIGCGGCKRQQVSYPRQLKLKSDVLHDTFSGITSLIQDSFDDTIIPSPTIWGYRNKIEYSFGDYKSGEIHHTRSAGFHKQGQFSQIIDINECFLVSQRAKKLFIHLKSLCRESGLPTYNQVKHTGCFRHLMIREGHHTGEFLVNLSISTHTLSSQEYAIWQQFRDNMMSDSQLHEMITTCIISINNGQGDSIYNRDTQQEVLWGQGRIQEEIHISLPGATTPCITTFSLSAQSFFQTNTTGAEALFSHTAEKIKDLMSKKNIPTTGRPLIDMYCGVGTIGILMNRLGIGSNIVGIEIVEDAIIDAKKNAHMNAISDSYFAAGKAEKLIHEDLHFRDARSTSQCVIVDPPREGLHPDVVSFLCERKKDKDFILVYISCNPTTLARDLSLLTPLFTLNYLKPVDMFPHTHHIENIALLS